MNNISNLATALCKFQSENTNVPLDNYDGEIKFCDMHTMADKISPLLAKYNLSVFVFFEELPEGACVKIRLYHQSGEMTESCLPILENGKIDDLNHYLRLAIGGLVGIADTDHS